MSGAQPKAANIAGAVGIFAEALQFPLGGDFYFAPTSAVTAFGDAELPGHGIAQPGSGKILAFCLLGLQYQACQQEEDSCEEVFSIHRIWLYCSSLQRKAFLVKQDVKGMIFCLHKMINKPVGGINIFLYGYELNDK